MPYIYQAFSFTFPDEGLYSFDNDIGVPVRSNNPDDIIFPNPIVSFSIDVSNLGFVTLQNTPVAEYFNLVDVILFGEINYFYDSFTINHTNYIYDKGNTIPLLTSREIGRANVKSIQLRYNFKPINVTIQLSRFVFV